MNWKFFTINPINLQNTGRNSKTIAQAIMLLFSHLLHKYRHNYTIENHYKLNYDPIKMATSRRRAIFDYNRTVYGFAIFDWVVL